MLAVVAGAGLAYTYFFGPDGSQQTATDKVPAPSPAQALPKPPKPAENARVGASIQNLTSPVAQGENAEINVRTLATAKCTIAVTYNGVAAQDSGLAPKVADDYGLVTWTWTVSKGTPVGTWPVSVTCAYKDKRAVVDGSLLVQAAGTPANVNN